MLAAKFFDDQYYNNAYYAKIGGVAPLELNNLEVEFLFMNSFTLFVTTDTYMQYYQELCNHFMNVELRSCSCNPSSSARCRKPLLPHITTTTNNTTTEVSTQQQQSQQQQSQQQ
uniref:Protein CNPPD1 n=1 Tax=Lygus hesperus TaxID=30085 RepID=A0A0A9Y109_LYGHE